MIDKLIGFIAPHYCYLCGIIGSVLCDSCTYNIVNEVQNRCFGCRLPSLAGVCPACAPQLPFSLAYAVGERKDELERLLDDFKFSRVYGIHEALGELLHRTLPRLPPDTVVVPIPTVANHVRIRGYDHADLIARAFCRRRGLKRARLLRRRTKTVQLGASARIRRQQAELAYECSGLSDPASPYLLLDDIATTGATLTAAARRLKAAGATTVIAAVVARQPLMSRR
jgi:ComF family protein